MADKTYCKGSGKKFEFKDGGYIINLSVQPAQLAELLKAYNKQRAKHGVDPVEYLPITISEKREVGKYGDTHYAYVSEYTPPKTKQDKPSKSRGAEKEEPSDELPW